MARVFGMFIVPTVDYILNDWFIDCHPQVALDCAVLSKGMFACLIDTLLFISLHFDIHYKFTKHGKSIFRRRKP